MVILILEHIISNDKWNFITLKSIAIIFKILKTYANHHHYCYHHYIVLLSFTNIIQICGHMAIGTKFYTYKSIMVVYIAFIVILNEISFPNSDFSFFL